MRVLTVVATLLRGGGIESFVANVLNLDRGSGREHSVCLAGRSNGPLEQEFRSAGIDVWQAPLELNRPLQIARRFDAGLRARRPFDVVHVHMAAFSGPILRVARRHEVPTRIAHYHSNPPPGESLPRRLYRGWLQRDVLRHATSITGCSWGVLESSFPRQWTNDQRMQVVRLGIPESTAPTPEVRQAVRAELGISDDAYVLGHVGRFRQPKNHAGLLRTAAQLRDRMPDIHVLLVGDGELEDDARRQTVELGLVDRVTFAGLRRDVPRMLAAMDMFVFPSLHEGFPLALVEAQAAGLPVVASAIPAAREALAPALRAFVRPAKDAAALADAVIALREETARNSALTTAGRAYAGQFKMDLGYRGMLALWGAPGAEMPADPCGGRAALLETGARR